MRDFNNGNPSQDQILGLLRTTVLYDHWESAGVLLDFGDASEVILTPIEEGGSLLHLACSHGSHRSHGLHGSKDSVENTDLTI